MPYLKCSQPAPSAFRICITSDTTADCVIESGMKANLCRALSAFDPNEAYKDSYRVKEALSLYNNYNNAANGRIKIDLSIHAEYTCLEDIVRRHSEKCSWAP